MAHPIKDKAWSGPVKAYLDALQARRRARLVQLVEEVGGQTSAIERLRKSQSQLSQLTTGKKAIGESLARDLEHIAEKPFGWLDWESDAEPGKNHNALLPDPLARKLMAMWPQLDIGDKRELIGMVAGWLQRRSEDSVEDYQRA